MTGAVYQSHWERGRREGLMNIKCSLESWLSQALEMHPHSHCSRAQLLGMACGVCMGVRGGATSLTFLRHFDRPAFSATHFWACLPPLPWQLPWVERPLPLVGGGRGNKVDITGWRSTQSVWLWLDIPPSELELDSGGEAQRNNIKLAVFICISFKEVSGLIGWEPITEPMGYLTVTNLRVHGKKTPEYCVLISHVGWHSLEKI